MPPRAGTRRCRSGLWRPSYEPAAYDRRIRGRARSARHRARVRPLPGRAALRHQGTALFDRLRPAVVEETIRPGRDRVGGSGGAARRLRQDAGRTRGRGGATGARPRVQPAERVAPLCRRRRRAARQLPVRDTALLAAVHARRAGSAAGGGFAAVGHARRRRRLRIGRNHTRDQRRAGDLLAGCALAHAATRAGASAGEGGSAQPKQPAQLAHARFVALRRGAA